jgi:hypothetical protein
MSDKCVTSSTTKIPSKTSWVDNVDSVDNVDGVDNDNDNSVDDLPPLPSGWLKDVKHDDNRFPPTKVSRKKNDKIKIKPKEM